MGNNKTPIVILARFNMTTNLLSKLDIGFQLMTARHSRALSKLEVLEEKLDDLKSEIMEMQRLVEASEHLLNNMHPEGSEQNPYVIE